MGAAASAAKVAVSKPGTGETTSGGVGAEVKPATKTAGTPGAGNDADTPAKDSQGSEQRSEKSGSNKHRLSLLQNIVIPQVKRAGTGERNFLGVALQFDNKREVAPSGCVRCTCPKQYNLAALETSDEYFVVEYIQEEMKKVTNYVANKKQSGLTKRGAKFMGPWFHADLETEIPLAIRHLPPPEGAEKWVEPWHTTRYLGYLDGYSRQKSRFRVWRRVARAKEIAHIEEPAQDAGHESREETSQNP